MNGNIAKKHGSSIHVGVSGWSYPDWAGVVYPRRKPKGFVDLSYVAQFVDAVEVNTTFYRPPPAAMCEKWIGKVADREDFLFTAKLWQRFTHERDRPWSADEVNRFKEGIRPLEEANKLGALLVQFPWSFAMSEANLDWLARLADAFRELPCVAEVRHASWDSDEGWGFLREHGLNACNIDQPHTRNSIGRTNIATGPIAYYRFHGRNDKAWFKKDAGRDERYNYLYSEDELAGWITAIERMESDIQQIFVMNNNHYRGQALVNALQIKAALTGEKVAAPPSLVEAYRVLESIVKPLPGQAELPF